MQNREPFHERLIRLREERGLTVHGAVRRMPMIGRNTLRRLESGEARPELTPAQTLLSLLHLYSPDLDLKHFTEDEDLGRFTAKRRRLVRSPKE